jgi:hypothetical protein
MMKTEHLLFTLLMIPALLIIAAGAISMADMTLPARTSETSAVTAGEPVFPAPAVWHNWLAMQPAFKSTLVP